MYKNVIDAHGIRIGTIVRAQSSDEMFTVMRLEKDRTGSFSNPGVRLRAFFHCCKRDPEELLISSRLFHEVFSVIA